MILLYVELLNIFWHIWDHKTHPQVHRSRSSWLITFPDHGKSITCVSIPSRVRFSNESDGRQQNQKEDNRKTIKSKRRQRKTTKTKRRQQLCNFRTPFSRSYREKFMFGWMILTNHIYLQEMIRYPFLKVPHHREKGLWKTSICGKYCIMHSIQSAKSCSWLRNRLSKMWP